MSGTAHDSNESVQRAARCRELINTSGDLRIFDQRRRVMWFESRIDHERSAASPVLMLGEGPDSIDIAGGV